MSLLYIIDCINMSNKSKSSNLGNHPTENLPSGPYTKKAKSHPHATATTTNIESALKNGNPKFAPLPPSTASSVFSFSTVSSLTPSLKIILGKEIPHISNQNLSSILLEIRDRHENVRPYHIAIFAVALSDLIDSEIKGRQTGLISSLKKYLSDRADIIHDILLVIFPKPDKLPENYDFPKVVQIFNSVFNSLTVSIPDDIGSFDAIEALKDSDIEKFRTGIDQRIESVKIGLDDPKNPVPTPFQIGKQWVQFNMMQLLWIEPERDTSIVDTQLERDIEGNADRGMIEHLFGHTTIRVPKEMTSKTTEELLWLDLEKKQNELITNLQSRLTELEEYNDLINAKEVNSVNEVNDSVSSTIIASATNSVASDDDENYIPSQIPSVLPPPTKGGRRRKTQKRLCKKTHIKSMKPKKRRHRRNLKTVRKNNNKTATKKR